MVPPRYAARESRHQAPGMHHLRRLQAAALIGAALTLTGCVAAIPIALDTALGAIGVVQRQRDREQQRLQTEEIRKLREAIEARWPELTPTDR